MAKANKPERDFRNEAQSRMRDLQDETAAGRPVNDDGTPMESDEFAEEQGNLRTRTESGRQSFEQGRNQSTSMRDKQGNEPPTNPSKR
jgi:hypothetical protein